MLPVQESYHFAWGVITEQKRGDFVIWEYSLTELLKAYQIAGKRLNDLQREVFYLLEKSVVNSTRDIATLLGMNQGWTVVPSHSHSVFYLVAHFSQQEQARQWAVNHLLFDTIPMIEETLMSHAEIPVNRH